MYHACAEAAHQKAIRSTSHSSLARTWTATAKHLADAERIGWPALIQLWERRLREVELAIRNLKGESK